MNDADFPVAKVLEGIDAAASAGLDPIKVNMVVKRGVNESEIVPMARFFRSRGHILRFRIHGRRRDQRLAMDDVVSAREIVDTIDADMPLAPANPITPRSRGALALSRRSGEIGVIASARRLLPRLHARAHSNRREALHLLFATETRVALAAARRRIGRGHCCNGEARLTRRSDRYSEIPQVDTAPLRKIEMSYIGG